MSDKKDDEVERVHVLHHCDQHIVVGHKDGRASVLPTLTEGKPIPPDAELVTFEEIPDSPHERNMRRHRLGSGPSRAATPKYRAGWDSVFGQRKQEKRKQKAQVLN